MVMVGCDCVREVVRWMKRTELDGEYGGMVVGVGVVEL
jgi:hypothetical protein